MPKIFTDSLLPALGRITRYNRPAESAPIFPSTVRTLKTIPSFPVYPEQQNSAILLNDGNIFVVAEVGNSPNDADYRRSWLYEPTTERWRELDPMPLMCSRPNLHLLDNGKVLVLGSTWVSYDDDFPVPKYILFDIDTRTFSTGTLPLSTELGGKSFQLSDHKIFVPSDIYDFNLDETINTTLLYTPSTDTWVTGAAPATLFSNPVVAQYGDRIIMYASASAATYHHASGAWFSISVPPEVIINAKLIAVDETNFVMIGGARRIGLDTISITSSYEYNVNTDVWTRDDTLFQISSSNLFAARLEDSRIVYCGGWSSAGRNVETEYLSSSYLYVSGSTLSGSYTTVPSLTFSQKMVCDLGGGQFLLIGPGGVGGAFAPYVHVYRPSTNTWVSGSYYTNETYTPFVP